MQTPVDADKPYRVSLEVKQMLPEEKDDPAAGTAAANKALMERLDGAAKTLVTATAILIALFAALGLTADRLTVLLNASESKDLVRLSVSLAVGAVICGTVAVALPAKHWRWETVSVALGTVFFLGALVLAVEAAASSSTLDGRPTITEVSVADAAGTGANLSFSVTSDGVAQNAGLRVVAIWVRNRNGDDQLPPFYSTVLRPNAKGVIQQKATVYLSRPAVETYIRIQAIRMSDPEQDDAEAAQAELAVMEPPAGTQCNDQTDQKTAPACADVLVPAAKPPAK